MDPQNNQRSAEALYRRFPPLHSTLESCSLGAFPTPVHPLHLAGHPQGNLWVKRDDLTSEFQGGNKVRKLELLLARGSAPVLTFGPWGSHHVLSTALHAKSLGRQCHAILVPQPMNSHHEEILDLIRTACTSTLEVPSFDFPGILRSVAQLPELWRPFRDAERCTVIPPGGTSPLGVLGYVAAGLELAAQIEAGLCPEPRRIYVPLGTGGTAAGLALGLALAKLRCEVVAVRVATAVAGNSMALHTLAHLCLKLLRDLGAHVSSLADLRLRVNHHFIGKGYALPHRAAEHAMALAHDGGLPLESTYTGKTLACMLAECSDSNHAEPALFWTTYGPAQSRRKIFNDMT